MGLKLPRGGAGVNRDPDSINSKNGYGRNGRILGNCISAPGPALFQLESVAAELEVGPFKLDAMEMHLIGRRKGQRRLLAFAPLKCTPFDYERHLELGAAPATR